MLLLLHKMIFTNNTVLGILAAFAAANPASPRDSDHDLAIRKPKKSHEPVTLFGPSWTDLFSGDSWSQRKHLKNWNHGYINGGNRVSSGETGQRWARWELYWDKDGTKVQE